MVISYTSYHISMYNDWKANDQVEDFAITIKEPWATIANNKK
jgi:hypothetical protein